MKEATLFHDFGQDAFGRLELILSGEGGEQINVAIGECVCGGKLNRRPGGYRYFAENTLTLRKGTHKYRFDIPKHVAQDPQFDDHKCMPPPGGEIAPFRYVELTGYSGKVEFQREVIHVPFDDSAADFQCENKDLNRIWNFCKYSIKAATAFDKYVDGNRERMPYEGDSYINQLGHFCCDRNYMIARDTIEFFFRYPTWPLEWILITPVLSRDYVWYSGDTDILKKWLPELEKKLLRRLWNADGLIHGDGEIRDIVDWPEEERDGYKFSYTNLVPNCYLYAALKAMYDLTAEEKYLFEATQLKAAIRRVMLKNGLFTDNPETEHTALHSAVFAVWSNIAEVSDYKKLSDLIQKRGMVCSVFAAQFLLEACWKLGLHEYAISLMTSHGLRSWFNMLEKGATITMEAWDDALKPNQDWNHAWGAAPVNIIPRFIGGIRPAAPGFKEFFFDPAPCGMGFFRLRHPTPSGTIEVEYTRGTGYKLTVPPNCKASGLGRKFVSGNYFITEKG